MVRSGGCGDAVTVIWFSGTRRTGTAWLGRDHARGRVVDEGQAVIGLLVCALVASVLATQAREEGRRELARSAPEPSENGSAER